MKSSIKNLSQSQVEITFEVPFEELQSFIDKAAENLGRELEVEGFRKGKAPKEVVREKVGEEMILQEAGHECIKESYLKALKEHGLEPLGQPLVSITKLAPNNPFEFKATIAVLPEIELPDYKKIISKIERSKIEVTQEEIDKIRQEKEKKEKERLRQEMLEKVAEASTFEVPQVLIDSEKDRALSDIKAQVPQMLGMTFEDYLKKINKTEEELTDSISVEAEKRVRNSLILREIQRLEKIEISEKELEDEMEKMSKMAPNLEKSHLKDYTESVIKNEKTFQKLEGLIKP